MFLQMESVRTSRINTRAKMTNCSSPSGRAGGNCSPFAMPVSTITCSARQIPRSTARSTFFKMRTVGRLSVSLLPYFALMIRRLSGTSGILVAFESVLVGLIDARKDVKGRLVRKAESSRGLSSSLALSPSHFPHSTHQQMKPRKLLPCI